MRIIYLDNDVPKKPLLNEIKAKVCGRCWNRDGLFPNVLVACEYSDTVAKAFREQGWFAVTNDLLMSNSVEQDATHLQGDILDAIDAYDWDLIVMHPPCTALAVSGNRWYGKGKDKNHERLAAIAWTNTVWNYACDKCDHVALENPVGVLRLNDGTRPVYIQPYQFGHMRQKKTGLWLHNLPALRPTNDVHEAMMKLPVKERQRIWYMPPGPDRWKERSRTYTGIAAAMAEQWTEYYSKLYQ